MLSTLFILKGHSLPPNAIGVMTTHFPPDARSMMTTTATTIMTMMTYLFFWLRRWRRRPRRGRQPPIAIASRVIIFTHRFIEVKDAHWFQRHEWYWRFFHVTKTHCAIAIPIRNSHQPLLLITSTIAPIAIEPRVIIFTQCLTEIKDAPNDDDNNERWLQQWRMTTNTNDDDKY
jgi:hypothetical protein